MLTVVNECRANFDCFGRDFFVPPGFIMPHLHPDDEKRLTDLHRCYSCASMRHVSMTFQIYDADVPMDIALLDSQTRLLAPLPRDAPRACTASRKFSVCVFCRRDLLRNRIAPPKPPRRQPDVLTSPSLIGSLTLITPVIATPPMTLMTSMTLTRRSTGETYPLECP